MITAQLIWSCLYPLFGRSGTYLVARFNSLKINQQFCVLAYETTQLNKVHGDVVLFYMLTTTIQPAVGDIVTLTDTGAQYRVVERDGHTYTTLFQGIVRFYARPA